MNARKQLLETLLPLLHRMAQSPDAALAAAAADEAATKSRELARIKRTLATQAEGAGQLAMRA